MEKYTSKKKRIALSVLAIVAIFFCICKALSRQMRKNHKFVKIEFEDFEDHFPAENRQFFAYFWYAVTAQELCSALIALKKLKSFGANKPQKDVVVEFVLPIIKENEDENLFYVNDENFRYLLKLWTDEGGAIGLIDDEFNFTQLLHKRLLVKYSFLNFGYGWVILLDPMGVPLKSMNNLFYLYSKNVDAFKGAGFETFVMAMPEAQWNFGMTFYSMIFLANCTHKKWPKFS